MEYVLGIDLGTSYFKFNLVDREGTVQGFSRLRVPSVRRQSARQEIEISSFSKTVSDGILNVLREAGTAAEAVRGVSYSSQANSFVLLDRDDQPLTPIILWSDERAQLPGPRISELWNRPEYLQTTGIPIRDLGMAIVKLDWIRTHEPRTWSRTHRILTLSDYLTFIMTGEHAGDQSTAGLLGLFDITAGEWWGPALDTLDLRDKRLATPFRTGVSIGSTRGELSKQLHLPTCTPFAVGALDHYAAAIGAGIGCLTDTAESTGTVLACIHLADSCLPRQEYCTGRASQGQSFYRLAFQSNGAVALEQYHDTYAKGMTMEELTQLASLSSPGASGLFAPPTSRGDIALSDFIRDHAVELTDADYVRAIMEAAAIRLESLIRDVTGSAMPRSILSTGGGARSDDWLQIKADMLGIEVLAGNAIEAGCFGAAIIASVAAGWSASIEEAAKSFARVRKRFEPNPAKCGYYSDWKQRYREMFESEMEQA